jgi:hypothetical protein
MRGRERQKTPSYYSQGHFIKQSKGMPKTWRKDSTFVNKRKDRVESITGNYKEECT